MKTSKLRNLLFVFCMCTGYLAQAQSLSGAQILSKMYGTLNEMNSLHYTISSIDSFISGNVWVQQGEAILVRDHANKQFPFKLYGKDSNGHEFVFDGQKALHIDHTKKQFDFNTSIHYRTFVGLQGGQMILSELVLPETPLDSGTGFGYAKTSVQELSDEYVLTLTYPDNAMHDVLNRVKILTINKKTWMPVSCYQRLETMDGEKQVNIRKLADIKLNDPFIFFPVIDPSGLIGYTENSNRLRKQKHDYQELLNTKSIDMQLKDIKGSVARLSDKKDKVIMLAFWETWCGPCIESIPKVKQLISKYAQDEFEVWSIVSDEKTFAKVPSAVKRLGINYRVYYGTEKTKSDYRVTGVPEYVIIDRSGKIVFIDAGFSEEIEKTLDRLLK